MMAQRVQPRAGGRPALPPPAGAAAGRRCPGAGPQERPLREHRRARAAPGMPWPMIHAAQKAAAPWAVAAAGWARQPLAMRKARYGRRQRQACAAPGERVCAAPAARASRCVPPAWKKSDSPLQHRKRHRQARCCGHLSRPCRHLCPQSLWKRPERPVRPLAPPAAGEDRQGAQKRGPRGRACCASCLRMRTPSSCPCCP